MDRPCHHFAMSVEHTSSKYIQRRVPVEPCLVEEARFEDHGRKSTYVGRRVPATPSELDASGDQKGDTSARTSSYISRRRCPESSQTSFEPIRIGLNVLDFSDDNINVGSQGLPIQKRNSIHGCATCTVLPVADLGKPHATSTDAQFGVVSSETVFLNIYDLGDTGVIQNLNVILKPLGSGAFHAAVQLYGREWSFGGLSPSDTPEQGDETGIWSCTPQACKQHSFREAVAVGATSLSPTDVLTILGEIADQWPMNSYDLLRRNCCHFCDEFCHLLGLGPLPEWVLNLANVGAVLDDGLTQIASRIRAAMSTATKLKLKGPRLEKEIERLILFAMMSCLLKAS